MTSQIAPGKDREEPPTRFSYHRPDDFFDDDQGSKIGRISGITHETHLLLVPVVSKSRASSVDDHDDAFFFFFLKYQLITQKK